MLRNIIGQMFDPKNGNFVSSHFFVISHSPCRKKKIFEKKQKRKKEKGTFGQIFDSTKGTFWTDF